MSGNIGNIEKGMILYINTPVRGTRLFSHRCPSFAGICTMSELENLSRLNLADLHKIIVGVDYGTTFTGMYKLLSLYL